MESLKPALLRWKLRNKGKRSNHSLCATRSRRLSHCTWKMNEIKTMMKEGADVDNINDKSQQRSVFFQN